MAKLHRQLFALPFDIFWHVFCLLEHIRPTEMGWNFRLLCFFEGLVFFQIISVEVLSICSMPDTQTMAFFDESRCRGGEEIPKCCTLKLQKGGKPQKGSIAKTFLCFNIRSFDWMPCLKFQSGFFDFSF